MWMLVGHLVWCQGSWGSYLASFFLCGWGRGALSSEIYFLEVNLKYNYFQLYLVAVYIVLTNNQDSCLLLELAICLSDTLDRCPMWPKQLFDMIRNIVVVIQLPQRVYKCSLRSYNTLEVVELCVLVYHFVYTFPHFERGLPQVPRSMSRFVSQLVSQSVSQLVSAFLFFVYVARRRTSSYGVAKLVQIAPLNCWRNSTPFLCKASFCTMKIDHFRARAIDHSVLFFQLLKSQILAFNLGIMFYNSF